MSERPSFSASSARLLIDVGRQVWSFGEGLDQIHSLVELVASPMDFHLKNEGAELVGLKLLELVDKILCLGQILIVACFVISKQTARELGQV